MDLQRQTESIRLKENSLKEEFNLFIWSLIAKNNGKIENVKIKFNKVSAPHFYVDAENLTEEL
jgi:hypothetical protein